MLIRSYFWNWRQAHSTLSQIAASLRYYPAWLNSFRDGHNAVLDRRPWMCFEAIEFLDSILTDTSLVFEYGSGGSTLFFVDRVKRVISVEHDSAWHSQITEQLHKVPDDRYEYLLVTPEMSDIPCEDYTDPLSYCSSSEQFRTAKFRHYCTTIDRYPAQTFDLVSIDGRARPSCIYHARDKVKPGGYLLLDNSDRDSYNQGGLLVSDWQAHKFFGPVPYNYQFAETTLWQRPSAQTTTRYDHFF